MYSFVIKGFSAKQIAEKLGISFRTVEEYINHLKIKTSAVSKNDLLKILSEKFT